MRRSVFTLCVVALLMPGAVTEAQIMAPLARNLVPDKEVLVTFWGQAQTESAGEDLNPLNSASAKFISTIHPHSRVLIFIAANRGAGLEEVEADSFELKSIAFPEASNSAFLAKLQANAIDRSDGKNIRHQLPVFADYALQRRNVKMTDGSAAGTVTKSFDVSTWYVGAGYSLVKQTVNEPFRLMLLASYVSMQITDGTVEDYRAIAGDPSIADDMRGPGVKIALNYNDFGFEFGYLDLKTRDGAEVDGLSGGLFTLAFSATGRLLDIYR